MNINYYDEQVKLNRYKKSLSDTLWANFPSKVNKNVRVITAYNPVVLEHNLNYYGIFIKQEFSDSKEFFNTQKRLEDKGIITEKLRELDGNNSKVLMHIRDIKGDLSGTELSKKVKYIIPNFKEEFSPVKDLISGNSSVVVLDTELLTDELKEHGLSKGLFVDSLNKKIIYWIIQW